MLRLDYYLAVVVLLVMGKAHSVEILNDVKRQGIDELLGSFNLIGGDGVTPFKLEISFANCTKLKDSFGNKISLISVQLKYKNAAGKWVSQPINNSVLPICTTEVVFSAVENNLQASYEMELWGNWNKTQAQQISGMFKDEVTVKIILP